MSVSIGHNHANMDKVNVFWPGNSIRYMITKMMVMMTKILMMIMVMTEIMKEIMKMTMVIMKVMI